MPPVAIRSEAVNVLDGSLREKLKLMGTPAVALDEVAVMPIAGGIVSTVGSGTASTLGIAPAFAR